MIFRIVFVIVILNILYEFIEVIFPSNKTKDMVKSFVLVLMLYVVCDYLLKLF